MCQPPWMRTIVGFIAAIVSMLGMDVGADVGNGNACDDASVTLEQKWTRSKHELQSYSMSYPYLGYSYST